MILHRIHAEYDLHTGRGEETPRHLRIYANHNTIVDFAEAEEIRPQLDISLQEGEVGVTEYPLRAATFANVFSLSLYFVRSPTAYVPKVAQKYLTDRAKPWVAMSRGYIISVLEETIEASARKAVPS